MFRSKTVFILGAGASEEAGMPIGSKLADKIRELLAFRYTGYNERASGDPALMEVCDRLKFRQEQWKEANFRRSALAVSEAMKLAPSIDTFLESHANNPEYVLLGKMAIARAILLAEGQSKMRRDTGAPHDFEIGRLANTWYISLAQQLFTGIANTEVDTVFNNVSFVDFNYDRCLPRFLHNALRSYFQTPPDVADQLLRGLPILHPYGNLTDEPFGADEIDLSRAAQSIKTYSESVASDVTEHIHQVIDKAETIIFLGFAFHAQNMQLLTTPTTKNGLGILAKRVFATTCGLSEPDEKVVRSQITLMLNGRSERGDDAGRLSTSRYKAAALFNEYWRSLTAD